MNILALEPYYGGSHQAFLTAWQRLSRHHWTLWTLEPYKWKWRMRHAALTWAHKAHQENPSLDLIFCSDMLNLAEFIGLCPPALRAVPRVVYFHENQLTYPVRHASERDYQFVVTNLTTALAAHAVWFNSDYHRRTFLDELHHFLSRMPDHQPLHAVEQIRARSMIQPPGIDPPPPRPPRPPGPPRLLWAARWEHDKQPEIFFHALDILAEHDVPFRLAVIGQQFRDQPDIFTRARHRWADRCDFWGYQASRADYLRALHWADVVVSTAAHEFFGLSMVEAVAAGAFPLLPRALAYPEVLQLEQHPDRDIFFHDNAPASLADRLLRLCAAPVEQWHCLAEPARRAVARFHWPCRVPHLDHALQNILPDSP